MGQRKTHTRKKAGSIAVKAIQQRAREETRGRARVPLVTVALVGIFVVMMVLVVMNHLNLVMVSNNTVDLQKSLEKEQAQNTSLTAQYQQMFDLASVRAAAEAAGMVKPGSGQVYYFTTTAKDETIVYHPDSPGLLEGIWSVVQNTVQDFFKEFGKSEDDSVQIGPQLPEVVEIIAPVSRISKVKSDGIQADASQEQTDKNQTDSTQADNNINNIQSDRLRTEDTRTAGMTDTASNQAESDERQSIGPEYIETAANPSNESNDSQKVIMPEGIENVTRSEALNTTVVMPEIAGKPE